MTTTNKKKTTDKKRLAADIGAANTLGKVHGYDPSDKRYTLSAIQAALDKYSTAKAAKNTALTALKTARVELAQAEETIHELILGAKTQVQAQFGKDSDQVHLVGLKQKSERVNRRKAKTPAAPATPAPAPASPAASPAATGIKPAA